jgi:ATP-dependent DNA helicase RecG
MVLNLETPVQYIKGVGPARAEMLRAAGIESVGDLLSWIPIRYEDREDCIPISALHNGDKCVIKGKIAASGNRFVRRRGFSLYEVIVSDGRGSISIKFFNQPYLSGTLKEGRSAFFYGDVRWDKYSGSLTMLNPEMEMLDQGLDLPIHSNRIVPVYRKIDKISGRMIRKMISGVLDTSPEIPEILPGRILRKHGFPGIGDAFQDIHFPSVQPGRNREDLLKQLLNFNTPAWKRLIYDEFFIFQAGLKQARIKNLLTSNRKQIKLTSQLRARIRSVLPFRPTVAQKKVLGEIVEDMVSPHRMSRLLQGDVGSGKTIVALQAAIVILENDYQVAFMAPTELLAEQHFNNFLALLQGTPYKMEFLSGSTRKSERRQILKNLASGETQLVVGTHSLIQEGVVFKELGLVVIDEQHRFGVAQRSVLAGKGNDPDMLVMTATPIPRSLAMTLYGDLDISLIDQMPPGRKPVKTLVKKETGRNDVYALVRERLGLKQQIYVICPLVEESEDLDLTAATGMFRRLQDLFPSFGVGLLHGKMNSEEKSRVMVSFRDGAIQVLVSTTVIEVGIDVPSATIMIIEHAERFGLSQLHQLRGRVGRGGIPGLCVLMTASTGTKEAGERLRVMCRSNDGFVIAEKDLEIRGPGDYLGVRQSGIADFHFGNLVKHFGLLAAARQDVSEMFDNKDISQKYRDRIIGIYQKRWGKRRAYSNLG